MILVAVYLMQTSFPFSWKKAANPDKMLLANPQGKEDFSLQSIRNMKGHEE